MRSYRVRMSSEIRDWLKELADIDPPAAMLAGQALTALIAQGADVGPPLVVPLAGSASPGELMELLDLAYAERLERLRDLRQGASEAAALATDISRRIAHLESAAGDENSDELRELQNLLPGVTAAERDLGARNQRAQADAEAFRTRKEVLKARCIAAQAEAAVDHTIRLIGDVPSDRGNPLRDIVIEIERELRPEAWSERLMELRPAALAVPAAPGSGRPPGGSDVRILFAIEPPGTALLLSVVEGGDAVAEHREEAVRVSAEVLRRVRAGDDPEASACGYDDEASFLAEFYPQTAEDVAAGAQAMLAGNQRGTLAEKRGTLAEQRKRLGVSAADLAERMGIRPERMSAIESGDPGSLDISTLASYVEALGGRLDVVAEIAGQRVAIR
jgi:DNA-binding XRE family transcriptional regulator